MSWVQFLSFIGLLFRWFILQVFWRFFFLKKGKQYLVIVRLSEGRSEFVCLFVCCTKTPFNNKNLDTSHKIRAMVHNALYHICIERLFSAHNLFHVSTVPCMGPRVPFAQALLLSHLCFQLFLGFINYVMLPFSPSCFRTGELGFNQTLFGYSWVE